MSKPPRLKPGDRVAIVSPSSGVAEAFPWVLNLGLDNLRSFGLEIVEFETCRTKDEILYRNPKLRAQDINRAFAEPSIDAIITTIGGDDSVRILPFLDYDMIAKNPKILVGYSDTTTLTTTLNQRGLVTFNGPSVMAGFAQMRHLSSDFEAYVRKVLFECEAVEFRPYGEWADRYVDWNTARYDGETEAKQFNEGSHWLQGEGTVTGPLFGGCIEVLEFLKGTEFWPTANFFEGKVLFFETSEDKPTVSQVKYMLRNYGSMGVLARVRAVLFGRARSYSVEEKKELDEMVRRVVAEEFGRTNLALVTNLDFGHTDPQWILPLGVEVELNCDAKSFRMLEAAVA